MSAPACSCDFPDSCAGLGALICSGCGGDTCVCRCGGELDCDGCDDCNFGEREDDFGGDV